VPKYKFKQWENGSGEQSRSFNLTGDTEFTAYYEKEVSEVSYEPSESPVGTAEIAEPAISTTLTLDPLSVTATKGDTTAFTGTLTDNSGVGISGKNIHLFIDGVDVGVVALTNLNGNFAFDYTWAESGTFTYQVKYLGD
jgi:hypothetical protein